MAMVPLKIRGTKQRMLMVANRLPITIKKKDTGGYDYTQSSGGLVTGLSGLPKDRYDMKWFGWAGVTLPLQERFRVEHELLENYGSVPIWIGAKLMEKHYNGYCNGVIWPLFHYHANDMHFEEKVWMAYRRVNDIFAQEVAAQAQDGDIIWVHDYHLMLMPYFLRVYLAQRGIRNVQIGFFLHTPFPSSSELRKLPYKESILEGLLHSDLVGFHTYDYARHFLNSCARLINKMITPNAVTYYDRTVHIGAFPIGIKPEKELKLLEEQAVIDRIDYLRNTVYKDKYIVIRVDRLDYIKGLPQKFHAIETLLTKHPHMIGKIVLVQIAVPSRQDVKEYQKLNAHISELAGRVNSKFGDVDYTPIVFRYTSVTPQELVALYAAADMCLVTSTRDGMNLVAYEYITCQKDRHGSLILSEFAGAAQSMKGCLVINPWAASDMVSAIMKAIKLTPEVRHKNWERMFEHVCKFTSEAWGSAFTEELMRISGLKAQKAEMQREETEADSLGSPGSTIYEGEDSESPETPVDGNEEEDDVTIESLNAPMADYTIAEEKALRRRSTGAI